MLHEIYKLILLDPMMDDEELSVMSRLMKVIYEDRPKTMQEMCKLLIEKYGEDCKDWIEQVLKLETSDLCDIETNVTEIRADDPRFKEIAALVERRETQDWSEEDEKKLLSMIRQ